MRRLVVFGIAMVTFATCAMAETIGSPLISRWGTDYNTGGLFAYDIPFSTSGQQVVSWAFFNNNAETTGRLITPLLFVNVGGAQFQVYGIGTTRTNASTGIQQFDFGLVAGSDIVSGTSTYFGWRDGSADGSKVNDGSIELDFGGGPGLYYFPTNAPTTFNAPLSVGDMFMFSDFSTSARAYSVEATAVPEPSLILLVGVGIGAVGLIGLRRY